MDCPFKIGDRIHELVCFPMLEVPTYGDVIAMERFFSPIEREHPATDKWKMPEFESDPMKPDATVTAITERGFTYRYDCRVPIGRLAWNTWVEEGECYEAGFHMWRKVE